MDIVEQFREIADQFRLVNEELISIRNKIETIEVYDKYERKFVRQPRNVFFQDTYNFIRSSQQKNKNMIIIFGFILTILEIINLLLQFAK